MRIIGNFFSFMKDLFDIEKKVVAVTGATGVLAGGTARYLASCGARVAFLGRSEDRLAEAREYCRENGFEGIAVKCDVLDKESCDRARDEILEKWGTVDALVNGAGGNLPGAVVPPDKTVFDIDPAQWSEVLNLNLGGTLIPTLSFCRHFEKTGAGAVVNFSSMTAQSAVTRVLGYSNAKAGVDNLTKWLAVEFAKKIGEGVRVNAVAPGFFISSQNRSLLTNPDGSLTSRGKDIVRKTPFGRFGEPEEVFGAVRFLCSDAAKFITGTVLPIDGGFSCFSGV